MNKNFYSLGLMSGTSMDGIDLSIIKSDGESYAKIIDNMYFKYEDKFKLKLRRIIKLCSSKSKFLRFNYKIRKIEDELTRLHGKACNLILSRNKKIKVSLIGFHGQTILHKPKLGYSIQIGNSKLLASITKSTVISNFRKNDILNGGQGAPLASLYHRLILRKLKFKKPSAIINIGGISNISYLKNMNKIISFDTGPGNCLIDEYIKANTKKNFDNKGMIASSGEVNNNILNKLLNNRFYKKKPPKSLDLKDFNLLHYKSLSLKDNLATLSMLTVRSICIAINQLKTYPKIVIISGGGRKNKFIFNNIKRLLNCPTFVIDKFKYDGDFIESQAFAYLAIRSYLKKFITLPSTTGVKKPTAGGMIFKY